jgi:hypothetical protein
MIQSQARRRPAEAPVAHQARRLGPGAHEEPCEWIVAAGPLHDGLVDVADVLRTV